MDGRYGCVDGEQSSRNTIGAEARISMVDDDGSEDLVTLTA